MKRGFSLISVLMGLALFAIFVLQAVPHWRHWQERRAEQLFIERLTMLFGKARQMAWLSGTRLFFAPCSASPRCWQLQDDQQRSWQRLELAACIHQLQWYGAFSTVRFYPEHQVSPGRFSYQTQGFTHWLSVDRRGYLRQRQ